MKVYLVKCYYYDYNECSGGNMLLGIYSSMQSAITARDNFVAAEIEDASGLNNPAQTSLDADNNPVVTNFYNGIPAEDNTFVIEEWAVQ